MPVWEDGVAGPDISNILVAVAILEPDAGLMAIPVDAVVVRGIVRVGDVERRVHDGNVVLALGMQSGKESFARSDWESVGVVGEVPILKHIIDVGEELASETIFN